MRKTVFYIAIWAMLMCFGNLRAQTEVRLRVATSDLKPVKHVEVSLLRSDTVVSLVVMESNEKTVTLPYAGEYAIEFDSPGYEPLLTTRNLSENSLVSVTLQQIPVGLEEVIVDGRSLPKTTATGQIYTLSGKAKKSGNPFIALMEIPALQVDIAEQSVSMNNGDKPLILVNGKLVNSGIAPINPQDIAAVEVNEVVSARYLQMGYTSMVNIVLRKNRPMYVYTEWRTRHDIPTREGFGGVNFEVGRKKFSIYGSVFAYYTLHDKTESSITERNGEQGKIYDGYGKNNEHRFVYDVIAQWQPNTSDYFSVLMNPSWGHEDGMGRYVGTYDNKVTSPMSITTDNWNRSRFYNWSVYYEHNFMDKSSFYLYGIYQHGANNDKKIRTEDDGEGLFADSISQGNKQDVVRLTMNYSTDKQKKRSFDMGNVLTWNRTAFDDFAQFPTLRKKVYQLQNYTYATYSDSWKKLYYMASLGMDHINVRVENNSNAYWRPRISTSLSYRLANTQQLRLSYYLNNSLPAPSMLVSFNTSTNPWMRREGNPWLVPIRRNTVTLAHSFYKGKWTLLSKINYSQYNDMIESYIRQEGDYQVQSYRNNGNYRSLEINCNPQLRINNLKVSATVYTLWDRYDDRPTKNEIGANAWLKWDFGPCYLYSRFGWRNHRYSEYSSTHYKNPIEANVQIGWQINKQFFISVSMPYYWGIRKDITTVRSGSYYSRIATKHKSASLRPWILFAWTLRKNPKESLRHRMPGQ